ncbi:hypothetical protein ACRAWD_27495 [Caulobacter segnis]
MRDPTSTACAPRSATPGASRSTSTKPMACERDPHRSREGPDPEQPAGTTARRGPAPGSRGQGLGDQRRADVVSRTWDHPRDGTTPSDWTLPARPRDPRPGRQIRLDPVGRDPVRQHHDPGQRPDRADVWASACDAKQQLRELIRQNSNHASVAVWGIANEVDLTCVRRSSFMGRQDRPARSRTLAERASGPGQERDPGPRLYHPGHLLRAACSPTRRRVANITDVSGAQPLFRLVLHPVRPAGSGAGRPAQEAP